MLSLLRRVGLRIPGRNRGLWLTGASRWREVEDPRPDVAIPPYRIPADETTKVKRARLLYQSRKRGMLENDLLLGTFAGKYLYSWGEDMLAMYDRLINGSHSDWDIYYWAVGARPVPPAFDNPLMALLQQHVRNAGKERRIRQPDLPLPQH